VWSGREGCAEIRPSSTIITAPSGRTG
jgi:hypothetical protein